MQGIESLGNLPEQVKDRIGKEFGSLNDLYRRIFNINHSEHMAHRQRDQKAISAYEQELLDIEDKLEELGAEDGRDITTAIASDYGDLVVKETIEKLNEHLARQGTDFESMREYLRKLGA
ncbi:hypothetical protein [Vreelandella sp.]|uniref:hypothetical protein n=1 Tax=Vreelandella sp. TaxID=3137778 RepID=UPI003BABB5A4